MVSWLQDPAVASALHVQSRAPTKPFRVDTSESRAFAYRIGPRDLRDSYRALAERSDVALLIFNGLADANVPHNGQVDYWADEETIVEEWAPWHDTHDTQVPAAGHVRTYRTSAGKAWFFVTIDGAGHEVPTYRPRASLRMLTQFLL